MKVSEEDSVANEEEIELKPFQLEVRPGYQVQQFQNGGPGSILINQPGVGVAYNPNSHQQITVLHQTPPRHRDYLVMSVIVAICINLPFGLAALFFSKDSMRAYKAGNLIQAKKAGHCAKRLNVAGVVLTVVIVVLTIIIDMDLRAKRNSDRVLEKLARMNETS